MAEPEQDSSESVEALLDAVLVANGEHLDRSHGEIAQGGMATVEIAVDRTLGRRVAIKLMHADLQVIPLAVRSFVREAQITGQLDHPNIVPIHELAVDAAGRLYFTMKLVEGRTLLELLDELRGGHAQLDARGLRISTTLAHDELLHMIDVFLKVLDAVAFAHARGVVHCDIKAENVMVGDFGQVYLMDWGIAKLLDGELGGHAGGGVKVRHGLRGAQLDEANIVMGTPGYMSPEQAHGVRARVDQRSDIFALGAMLFEILTGHAPYQSLDTSDSLEQARACNAVLLPHLAITRELRRIVGVAMDAEPARRYQSVDELRRELLGFLRGGDSFARQRFSKGDYLIREGQVGDAAFILISGRCEVFKQVQGKRESLRLLGPGDVFGETAILASSPRTASVLVLSEVLAVVVTADALEQELDVMKPWMSAFIRALASRFTDVEKRALDKLGDPMQVTNLALMILQTWGQRDPQLGLKMSALQLCEQVAKLYGISENAALKILRKRSEFQIELGTDLISLRDAHGLAADIRSSIWP